MLVLQLKDGEPLWIGEACVRLERRSGRRSKIVIAAPRGCAIGFEKNIHPDRLAALRAAAGQPQDVEDPADGA